MNRLHTCFSLLSFIDPASVAPFFVVNDVVMGGLSTSRLGYADESLVFEGKLSLEQNGGFASFRGPVSVPADARALVIRLRGDGKHYKFTLRPEDCNTTWYYQAPFETTGDWQTLRFQAGDFSASRRGRPALAPRLDFGRVQTLGVLISDQQAGPFRLQVREVHAE